MCEATASNSVPQREEGEQRSHSLLGHGNQVRFVIGKLSGSTFHPDYC